LVQEELIASFPQFHLLLYGGLLILIVLFEPSGVMGLFQKASHLLRARSGVGAHS
jgi:branched-chain amino acid transport system permease protein